MSKSLQTDEILDGFSNPDTVRALEIRVSVSALTVGIAIAATNLVALMQVYDQTFSAALGDPGVWLTFASGVATAVLGMSHSTVGRVAQALLAYALSCLVAAQSSSGELTSVIFLGLSLLIASQYGLLRKNSRLILVSATVVFGVFLTIGTYLGSNSASLGAVLNLVGAGFLAYLFVVIAAMRLQEMKLRQSELERMVRARTKDLQEEADRRKVAEEEARATAERNATLANDRAVLLRELHHRSKNDLQMIYSLLSLRAEKGDRPELIELFRPTQNRIRAIAIVHEQLDNSERFDAIGFRDYLESLLNFLQVSHREYPVGVNAEIAKDVSIKLESATHIGLLVHELMLCSYRYSFDPGNVGTISVSADRTSDKLLINIKDTGRGLPKDINPAAPDLEEIAIVEGLVKRLKCKLSLESGEGTSWSLAIPLSVIEHQTALAGGR